ncbi:DUF427 domain-containing protein [Bradyrhizobium roseum]|uniref:DUF427 domain-containing protein n=1 Tax=Bradyrhizobium roseum TaxID=3056648 RepID=UPI00260494F3|nr:DUF427 domain-containing protein [Bradyrhizobium roseus]WKA30414.1 DUF427 domain-containing protein [Bradyrhizobium roseus]
MVKALWNGKVIAESNRTEIVEGNHYFPIEDVRSDFIEPSDHKSSCPWKGVAQYYSVVVDGERNRDAAWYYADPKPAAKNIAGRVAFWKGVKVEP